MTTETRMTEVTFMSDNGRRLPIAETFTIPVEMAELGFRAANALFVEIWN